MARCRGIWARLCPVGCPLSKGAHVFVQGELSTREYNRTTQVPSGKKTIEHVIQQPVVELKADTIRLLDRSGGSQAATCSDAPDENERPAYGASRF